MQKEPDSFAVDDDLLLEKADGRWQVRDLTRPSQHPVFVDFTSARSNYRRLRGGGRGQALARAIGAARPGTTVIDATAGFATDAFVLASLGCRVILIERDPTVVRLLEDGLERARREPAIAAIANRMTLLSADAVSELARLPVLREQVIYLDPMYPPTRKHAAVRKHMTVLRRLVGQPHDHELLLEAALASRAGRIVVKRPRGADTLGSDPPSTSIRTPNTRYDIYVR